MHVQLRLYLPLMIYQYKSSEIPRLYREKNSSSLKRVFSEFFQSFFRSGDNVIQEKTEGIPASPHIDSATRLCRLMKSQLAHNKTNAVRISYHMANPKPEVNTKTHLLFPDVRYPYRVIKSVPLKCRVHLLYLLTPLRSKK